MPRLLEFRRDEVTYVAYRFRALVLSRDSGYPGLGLSLFRECWMLIWERQICGRVKNSLRNWGWFKYYVKGDPRVCGTSDSRGSDSRDECDALFLIRD
jgi:hypothetical protein